MRFYSKKKASCCLPVSVSAFFIFHSLEEKNEFTNMNKKETSLLYNNSRLVLYFSFWSKIETMSVSPNVRDQNIIVPFS